jgi:16S rRNA (uracil1498-N3)-methyltransferase
MVQFFVPPSDVDLREGRAYIKGSELHHLAHTLRKRKGDRIKIFTANGLVYNVEIMDINKNVATCRIIEEITFNNQRKVIIALYQAILKPMKMDFVIQKATELGINNITPLVTHHTIAKIHDIEKKVHRWEKIILSAVKQSELHFIPKITPPMHFNKAIDLVAAQDALMMGEKAKILNLLFHEKYGDRVSAAFTKISISDIGFVNIFIGPEGGFSEEEVLSAKERNFVILNLGSNVLRSETASIVAVSLVLFLTKEI